MCPLKCFFVLSHHVHPHALATDWNWFLKSMAYQTTVGEVTRSDIRYGWLKGLICIYWRFVYSIEWNMDYIKQWQQRTCKCLKEIRITWYTGYMESIYKPCNPSGTYLSSSWNSELFAQSMYIAKTILPKFHPYPILIHLNTVVQTSWKVVLAKSPYWKRERVAPNLHLIHKAAMLPSFLLLRPFRIWPWTHLSHYAFWARSPVHPCLVP